MRAVNNDGNHENNNGKSNTKNRLFVVGIGFRPLDSRTREMLASSDVIFSSGRIAEVFKRYDDYEALRAKVTIINSVEETMRAIERELDGSRTVAVLASGDPLFYGIGRRIIKEFGEDEVELIPDVSSIQAAFARIKLPWDDALLVSVHGGIDKATNGPINSEINGKKQDVERDGTNADLPNTSTNTNAVHGASKLSSRNKIKYRPADIPALVVEHNKIAVLTDPVNNPVEIAKALLESLLASDSGDTETLSLRPRLKPLSLKSLTMYVCERLGYEDERITRSAPEEIVNMMFVDPNVVIVHKVASEIAFTGVAGESEKTGVGPGFGLTENDIAHERGLITKDEVRAITIHKLRLPQSGVLWDVGAGSGSVSLEAARLCPNLKVFAIEKYDDRADTIAENMARFGVANVEVVRGAAPVALGDLPSPERVFVGGSAGQLKSIIRQVSDKMVSGIIVINAATLDTLQEGIDALERNGYTAEVVQVAVSRMKIVGGKRLLSALNPVFVLRGERV